MADIKISQLASEIHLSATDVTPIVSNGVTKKTTMQAIQDFTIGTEDNSELGADVSTQISTLNQIAESKADADDVDSEIQTLTNNLDAEVSARAKLGAHNLFDSKSLALGTQSGGINYTVNDDYSLSIIGGTTGTYSFVPFGSYRDKGISIPYKPNTKYVFSIGEEKHQTNLMLRAYIKETAASEWAFIANEADVDKVEFTTPATIYDMMIRPEVLPSRAISTTTLYPTVCLATDASTDFEPYTMTNRELTDRVVKSSKIDLPSTSIAVGSTETITIPSSSLPSDFHKALAIIPISVGPEGWSTTLPGVFTNVNLTNLTVSVRAYTAQNFAPTVILLYV